MSNSNNLISSIYDCNLCKNLLVDPVTVPCGNNLCKHHLDTLVAELPKKATFYRCEICQEEHQIPNKGFMVNKQLHNVLELELQNSVFYKFFKKINETQDYMELVESLDINSDKKITEFFDDLKAQVDSRRMLLIDQIEKESSAIVESINNTQTDIMKKSREANRILKNIKNPKSEFQELLESLSISDQIEENKFEKLRINLNYIYDQFSNRIKENDAFLSRNTKDRFNFEFEEKPISEVFGQYVELCDGDTPPRKNKQPQATHKRKIESDKIKPTQSFQSILNYTRLTRQQGSQAEILQSMTLKERRKDSWKKIRSE